MRTRSHPALALPAFAVVTIAALTLSGCVGGESTEVPPPTPVTIDEVTVPASLATTQPYVTVDSTVLPGVAGLPWLVGGSSAPPAAGGIPTIWSSPDGSSWTGKAVDPNFEGSFDGDLAGSDQLSALAGNAWRDGDSSAVVWTSTDRATWNAVKLPKDFAGSYRVVDAAVTGTTVVVIGATPEGESRGIRVDGDKVTEFDLPDAGDEKLLQASAIVATGKTLLLLGAPGAEGEPAASVTWLSADLGDSWGEPSTVTDEKSNIAGVTYTGSGYVATGSAPRDAESNATGNAAWSSADGTTWAAESVPSTGEYGTLYYHGSADAGLSAPNANGGTVMAVMWNDNAAVSGIYQRGADGQWSYLGETGANPGSGAGGLAVAVAGAPAVVLLGQSGYLRGGLFDGSWRDTTVLAAREDVLAPSAIYPAEDRALVTLSRSTFELGENLSWRNSSQYSIAEVADDTLTETQWSPPEAAALTGVLMASDETGAEVLIGSSFPADTADILAQGWYRSAPDAGWTPMTGFDASGATSFSAVQKVGDEWVAVGRTRDSGNVGNPEHGVIWASADGVTWARGGGDFGSGTLETSIADVCALPDGGQVAVGWVEESVGSFRSSVWMGSAGTWTRADIGDLGSKSGYATACATGEKGVVMAANVGGRSTLQLSSDGATWTEELRADRGATLGEPVPVPGGFAASGSVASDSFTGPVVWLSADGADWSPVSIPSYKTGSTTEVAPYGDDLLVTMSARTGHPVSIVRDIKTVIADNAK